MGNNVARANLLLDIFLFSSVLLLWRRFFSSPGVSPRLPFLLKYIVADRGFHYHSSPILSMTRGVYSFPEVYIVFNTRGIQYSFLRVRWRGDEANLVQRES